MRIGDLILHFLDCLNAARDHYVTYKVVDWNLDLFQYNTILEHGRIVIKTDFSANPNLSGWRTATGSVKTHAVLCILIVYEYNNVVETDDDGNQTTRVECTKRSSIYIGSAKGVGKNSNHIFHGAAIRKEIEDIMSKRGSANPLKEVVITRIGAQGSISVSRTFSKLQRYLQQKAGRFSSICLPA